MRVQLSRRGNVNCKCFVKYRTVDGSAKAGEDYLEQAGELQFNIGQTVHSVEIGVIDDEIHEEDENFFVELYEPRADFYACTAELDAAATRSEVTIIDDDEPGELRFESAELRVVESAGSVTCTVVREGGSSGEVRVKYRTEDLTATGGADYERASGELIFKEGECSQSVTITILNDESYEKDESFKIVLYDCSGGAALAADGDGRPQSQCSCHIHILNDDEVSKEVDSVARLLGPVAFNKDQAIVGAGQWGEQFETAWLVNGGEDEFDPSRLDWAVHYLSLPWKLLFACIPPTLFFGGKATFVVALVCIGAVTAIIGDVAALFGCVLGMPDAITAITFVALGTSLPDTFASRTAAIADATADAAVGNVTGSNAVNVFLGLGLPWMIGALYWSRRAPRPSGRRATPTRPRSTRRAASSSPPATSATR